MAADTPSPGNSPGVSTLGQLTRGADWRLSLAHFPATGLLIWITRGQGLALLDGVRRGVGVHNALFVPPRRLFALDLGRQGFGQALTIPAAIADGFPQDPYHLRTRDAPAQAEFNTLLDALAREQGAGRPHAQDAMRIWAELTAIWLQRQLASSGDPALPDAGTRLMAAYCARLAAPHPAATTMAEHAEALGVTPTHLSRVSKTCAGRTAAALQSETVLHRARSLLVDTRVPVQNIAQHLGFASAAYFTRFIHRHTGHAPTALRRAGTSTPARAPLR